MAVVSLSPSRIIMAGQIREDIGQSQRTSKHVQQPESRLLKFWRDWQASSEDMTLLGQLAGELTRLLKKNRNIKSKAAEEGGISRVTFYQVLDAAYAQLKGLLSKYEGDRAKVAEEAGLSPADLAEALSYIVAPELDKLLKKYEGLKSRAAEEAGLSLPVFDGIVSEIRSNRTE